MKRVLVLTCLISANAQAVCLGTDPVSAARSAFESHYAFYNQASVEAGVVTGSLAGLLVLEASCSGQGELCAIEADPWTSAQDGEAENPAFAISRGHVVAVTYTFRNGPHFAEPKTAYLHMGLIGSECWAIEDLIDPQGHSLRAQLQEFHAAWSGPNHSLKADGADAPPP